MRNYVNVTSKVESTISKLTALIIGIKNREDLSKYLSSGLMIVFDLI